MKKKIWSIIIALVLIAAGVVALLLNNGPQKRTLDEIKKEMAGRHVIDKKVKQEKMIK